jgi:[protein-PII] uridylyltransferase
VLAVNRLAVRSARTETVGRRATTVWTVQPEYGEPPGVDRLREDVRLALAGSFDVASKLQARAAAYSKSNRLASPPAQVAIVPGASARATVIEVRAHDAHGLLHTVASAISSVGISIVGARVATLGSEVVDVFYLTDGEQPADLASARAAQAAILTALAESAVTGE